MLKRLLIVSSADTDLSSITNTMYLIVGNLVTDRAKDLPQTPQDQAASVCR